MFENKTTPEGDIECPACKKALYTNDTAPNEGAKSDAVQTPTGLWLMHKRCVSDWNTRANIMREALPSRPHLQQDPRALGDGILMEELAPRVKIDTLIELVEYLARNDQKIDAKFVTDRTGIKWLTVLGPEGEYWFWSDGTVMQVL